MRRQGRQQRRGSAGRYRVEKNPILRLLARMMEWCRGR